MKKWKKIENKQKILYTMGKGHWETTMEGISHPMVSAHPSRKQEGKAVVSTKNKARTEKGGGEVGRTCGYRPKASIIYN